MQRERHENAAAGAEWEVPLVLQRKMKRISKYTKTVSLEQMASHKKVLETKRGVARYYYSAKVRSPHAISKKNFLGK